MAKQSEEYKIAKMQMVRDLVLGGFDVITRNPTIGLLMAIFIAEGGQRLGWIAPSTKSTLVGSLVAGNVIGNITKGFSQGSPNTPAPLPAAIDIATKGVKALAKGGTKLVKAVKSKVKGQKALQGEVVYMLPE